MEKTSNKRVVFLLPEETTITEVIDEILIKNSLPESAGEFLDKYRNGKEPRLLVIRDAAMALFQGRVPEEKLAEFLAKHLNTKKETAGKIINEIKEKLLPYAKVVTEEEIEKQEVIAKKPVVQSAPEPETQPKQQTDVYREPIT